MSAKKQLFHVGDYVVAIDESFGFGNVAVGDVGVVKDVRLAPPNMNFDYLYSVKFHSQDDWGCTQKDLRIATNPEKSRSKGQLMQSSLTATATGIPTATTSISLKYLTRAVNKMAIPQFISGDPYAKTPFSQLASPVARKPRKPRLPKYIKDAQPGDLFAVISDEHHDHEFSSGQKVIFQQFEEVENCYLAQCWDEDRYDYYWVDVRDLKPTTSGKITFDSVILSEAKKAKILATVKQVDNHSLIFDEWGFGDVLEKGKAISMLFYGPPGTGKTLMAQAISDHFNKKLKIIGSAEIESSEPGQAERNIKAFFEGTKSDTVLLFDECDSLVYSREHVGSILAAQVNQLLSSLEQYEGIVIFTTNRLGVLDEAFNRRLSLKLEFDMPNHKERTKIWQRMIPKKAPIADDVNWEDLAEVELSGGYIKNVVLRAARMAAAEDIKDKDKKITMRHLVDALTDEVESVIEFDEARSHNHTPKLMGGNAGISRTSDVRRTVERGTNR